MHVSDTREREGWEGVGYVKIKEVAAFENITVTRTNTLFTVHSGRQRASRCVLTVVRSCKEISQCFFFYSVVLLDR